MEQMLNVKLKFGDIEDVEGFCSMHLNTYLKKNGMTLREQDREDLMSFLMALVWELYDSKWSKKGSFSGYAAFIISKRITDYFRQKWGRNSQKLAIEQAIPFSQLGTINSSQSEDDRSNSSAYLAGVLLR